MLCAVTLMVRSPRSAGRGGDSTDGSILEVPRVVEEARVWEGVHMFFFLCSLIPPPCGYWHTRRGTLSKDIFDFMLWSCRACCTGT